MYLSTLSLVIARHLSPVAPPPSDNSGVGTDNFDVGAAVGVIVPLLVVAMVIATVAVVSIFVWRRYVCVNYVRILIYVNEVLLWFFHCKGPRKVVLQILKPLRTMWNMTHMLKCVSSPTQLTALSTRQPCSSRVLTNMAPLAMRMCPCVSHKYCAKAYCMNIKHCHTFVRNSVL